MEKKCELLLKYLKLLKSYYLYIVSQQGCGETKCKTCVKLFNDNGFHNSVCTSPNYIFSYVFPLDFHTNKTDPFLKHYYYLLFVVSTTRRISNPLAIRVVFGSVTFSPMRVFIVSSTPTA